MMATIAINVPEIRKCQKLAGIKNDRELADRMQLDAGNLSRVLTGRASPGPKFLAGLVVVFGVEWFADLVDVVSDDPAA